MRRVALIPVVGSVVILIFAIAAPRADAGACGSFRSTALALVPPDGDVPLDGESGLLVREVAGGVASGPRSPGPEVLLERVRVVGAGGPVRTTVEPIAPGLRRLSGRFRAGVHRIRGLGAEATVRFVTRPPSPLAAPVVVDAQHHRGTGGPTDLGAIGIGGRGWQPTPSVTVSLGAPPPPGAWMALLYVGPVEHRGAAIHAIELGAGATRVGFTQQRSPRCGPNLPLHGVPAAGGELRLKWLTRHGRLSPSSGAVVAVAVD